MSWFPDNVLEIGDSKIPLYQVSPYYLKDERGSHPSEYHVNENKDVLPAYWAWRHKLLYNPYPVRYPNGYHGRRIALCCLWPNETGQYRQLSYIEARKKIYCPEYARPRKTIDLI